MPQIVGTAPFAIHRLAWRHAWRRPLQSFFLVAGVAIGVAMIVAIDLANSSAQTAFELGTETVTGRATHEIVGGPNGLDESIYTELRRDMGYRLSAPVVENYVVVAELDGQPMRLLGVDPFAEAPFRAYLQPGASNSPVADYLAPLMTQPSSVLISADVAAALWAGRGRYAVGATGRDDASADHRRAAPTHGRPEPPRAGNAADCRHQHGAGSVGPGGTAGPYRPDHPRRPGGAGRVGPHRGHAAAQRADRGQLGAKRYGRRDDRGLSPQPHRAQSAGAGGGDVPDLQHGHV